MPADSLADARAETDRESSIDDLERTILTVAARLNAVTHDFLVLIRRFDERAGWLAWASTIAPSGCTGAATSP